MDLNLTIEERDFREEVRTWLREHVPTEAPPPYGKAQRDYDMAWQRAQHDGGWAGIAWPVEVGGRGLSLVQQLVWFEEYAWAGAPHEGTAFVGNAHAGPTLIACGTDEVRARYLPAILRGDEVWCQGFSEPGAGSDLAGLSTRGVIDGDEIVVTGQKVWTSYAEVADRQELLVRTSTGDRRHDGITWVVCDMDTPGIEVRPIRTVLGTGEFSEVFYDEVRLPLSNVVGEIDKGWRVAMSTLSFERGTAFMSDQIELISKVDDLIERARTRGALKDDELALRLATARAEAQAVRAMTLGVVSRNARSAQPGPEASMVRLAFSQLQQRVGALAVDVLGDDDPWARYYLYSFATTIAAGSKDIQRGIIAERVLGLPKGR